MLQDIVILGSQGCAKAALWLLESVNQEHNEWNILGFVDKLPARREVDGYPVLGDDQWLLCYRHPVCAVCAFGSPGLRRRVVEKYRHSTVRFPTILSPMAMCSSRLSFGSGNLVCSGAIMEPDSVIQDFSIFNMGCTIGHETYVGSFVTVNPTAAISGCVTLESGCEIGAGAKIIQGLRIGEDTVVGAGSVIIRDCPPHCTVVGNPGRIIKRDGIEA